MADYNIEDSFRAIENELMTSMVRNMKRHRAEENDMDMNWSMWQTEQLKALEKYKKANANKFTSQFSDIHKQIELLIWQSRQDGGMDQEAKILQAMKNGFKAKKISKGTSGEFFRLNTRKLEALIEATQNDLQKAERAMLRMSNDQYRKVIYNAQVYANTGAGTYEQAVDMATKEFMSRGINCIEYANGARHTIAEYAAMAIQTASKRAYLTGEGEKRQEWGIHTVIMNKRGNACPLCIPFVGKVLIDDVWSGGSSKDGQYMLMSTAMSAGLYHPRCKDSHSTYFPGISSEGASYTKEDLQKIKDGYVAEQKQQYAKRQADKFTRLADNSLDEDNQKKYREKAKGWKNRVRIIHDQITGGTTNKMKSFDSTLESIEDKDIKTLLMQARERTSVSLSTRNVSYFDGKNIFLAPNANNETIAHELFHEIDQTYGLNKNNIFSDGIKADYIRLVNLSKGYGKSIPEMLYSKYPYAFYKSEAGMLLINEKYRGISDILHGMSSKEIWLGYGHSRKNYWDKPLALEKETFAQYGRMLYSQDTDVLKMAKELFPNTNKKIMDTLKGMIK